MMSVLRLLTSAAIVSVSLVSGVTGSAGELSIDTSDFDSLDFSGNRAIIGGPLLREITSRLEFLRNVGLDYLSLDRNAETLSGGEAQRIRLASQIGSGLVGVMYILDEPSIGLHQRDNQRLLNTLTFLRDLGNTVIVVEHDEDAIRSADHVVDIGPGAGVHGGRVIAQGKVADICAVSESVTGDYLSGRARIEINQDGEFETYTFDTRLKHLYLVIATLSFQMIFQWTINFMQFFNQGQTIAIGRVFWFTGKVARKQHYFFWYYVILVFVVVLGFAVRNLLRSKHGRCLVAVRDNDRAADAMGMHPGLTKVYAFALAGFFAGMAGALHAYVYRGVGFESFTLHESIAYLAMAIVGGLGTLNGSFWGPAAIMTLDLQVEHLAEKVGSLLPSNMNLATALNPLSFGLVIVLFLMFEPRGIANWWRIARSYTKLWPFRY